jgi:hypothetical protein
MQSPPNSDQVSATVNFLLAASLAATILAHTNTAAGRAIRAGVHELGDTLRAQAAWLFPKLP